MSKQKTSRSPLTLMREGLMQKMPWMDRRKNSGNNRLIIIIIVVLYTNENERKTVKFEMLKNGILENEIQLIDICKFE